MLETPAIPQRPNRARVASGDLPAALQPQATPAIPVRPKKKLGTPVVAPEEERSQTGADAEDVIESYLEPSHTSDTTFEEPLELLKFEAPEAKEAAIEPELPSDQRSANIDIPVIPKRPLRARETPTVEGEDNLLQSGSLLSHDPENGHPEDSAAQEAEQHATNTKQDAFVHEEVVPQSEQEALHAEKGGIEAEHEGFGQEHESTEDVVQGERNHQETARPDESDHQILATEVTSEFAHVEVLHAPPEVIEVPTAVQSPIHEAPGMEFRDAEEVFLTEDELRSVSPPASQEYVKDVEVHDAEPEIPELQHTTEETPDVAAALVDSVEGHTLSEQGSDTIPEHSAPDAKPFEEAKTKLEERISSDANLTTAQESLEKSAASEKAVPETPTVPSRPDKQRPVVPQRPTKARTDSSPSVNSESEETSKKAPPPKPKKLSSKIAAFQQMFNQPQEPKREQPTSRSPGKLSSDGSGIAATLQNMMGRGVAMPGMVSPEMLRSSAAAEQSEEPVADVKPVSAPRRARGPRGKKLPSSIKDATISVEPRFQLSVSDLWEVTFTKSSEPVAEKASVDTAIETGDDVTAEKDEHDTVISGIAGREADAIDKEPASKANLPGNYEDFQDNDLEPDYEVIPSPSETEQAHLTEQRPEEHEQFVDLKEPEYDIKEPAAATDESAATESHLFVLPVDDINETSTKTEDPHGELSVDVKGTSVRNEVLAESVIAPTNETALEDATVQQAQHVDDSAPSDVKTGNPSTISDNARSDDF